MALSKFYSLIRFQLPLLIPWWLLSLKSVTFILCPTIEGSLTFSSILDLHYKILFHNLSNFLSCHCCVSFSVCLQFSFSFFINSVFFLTLVPAIFILCCTSTVFYMQTIDCSLVIYLVLSSFWYTRISSLESNKAENIVRDTGENILIRKKVKFFLSLNQLIRQL